ncbi:hypothetical protein E2562_009910, partial [Oryza meyeriana var. granulata]
MPRPKGRKRVAAVDASKPEDAVKEPAKWGRGKRAKASHKPKPDTECVPEKWNLVR